ncbi:ABC transporter permease [Sporichthya polymorpha]|uniref:ABC transporter permease n=1 Tax=Sporichthya polymorpha TaxID=35751 RepID=UPI00035C9718|nr:ABC transporter permease [Sporichthya polymorpha]
MTAWRAALRLARRDALRHKWRSLLIVVLILAPVAAATGVDVLYRTQTSPALERERAFGGADAVLYPNYTQDSTGVATTGLTQDQVERALPAGSRVVFEQTKGEAIFAAPGHLAEASYLITNHLGDPLTRANAHLKSGRAPKTGEVAISPKLADKLGLAGDGIGATISLRDGASAKVSGIARDPFCLSCALVVVPGNSDLARDLNADAGNVDGAYYIDLPKQFENASIEQLRDLRELDLYVQLRSQSSSYEIGLGDLSRASGEDLKAAALVTLVAGLGLLEVVLLAGTAFAVGARRQTRDLGMIAAQGGSPGDLRRVVLAQGLLLGLVGAVAGVAAGIGGVVAARPLLERINNEVMIGIHFGWTELLVVALVGVGSGLAAAMFPAITAGRRRIVDALAARFPVPTARSRWAPLFGGVLIAGGVTLSLIASSLMSSGPSQWFEYGPSDRLSEFTGSSEGRLDDTTGSIAILVGVFVVVAGLLLLAPALLAALAKLAGRLPVTLRLATRDAARHRHRTGPATAAIAVAVGGAVAISCLIASDREGTERFEADAVPDRVIALDDQSAVDRAQLAQATAAVQQVIPGATVLPIELAASPPDASAVDNYFSPLQVVNPEGGTWAIVGIGNPDVVALASGRVAGADVAKDALDDGKAVVFDRDLVETDGRIAIQGTDADGEERTVRLAAVVLPRDQAYTQLPGAFVPRSFAESQGWEIEQSMTLLSYPAESREQAGAAIAAAEALGIPVISSNEEKDYTRMIRVGLTAAAALIALLGVAMCVALSAAEGRPDLATLSAIGAPPSRRRRLAGAQALVLAVLGVALGLGFGFYFAHAARPATGASETIVPWGDLLLTVAAVPLLAVLVAMLGSVGRVPLTRRAD